MRLFSRLRSVSGVILGIGVFCGASSAFAGGVSVFWGETAAGASGVVLLKSWSPQELKLLPPKRSREKDPFSQRVSLWGGVLLGDLVQTALQSRSVEDRAQVDLLVLTTETGERAFVPRAFIQRYPLLLAYEQDGRGLEGLSSVMPWTSHPKIAQEGAPLESFFLRKVSRIELANYRVRYGSLFLKRRTDPAAMRGEKLFLQNCMTCHASGPGPSLEMLSGTVRVQRLADAGHPKGRGAPQLSEKDLRSLRSYLDAYRGENSGAAASESSGGNGNQSAGFGLTAARASGS